MKIRISPLTAALATAILVVPGTAAAKSRSAGTVQLDGVRTTLTTDPATTAVLLSNGILPLPVGPATVSPQFGPHGLSLAYAFPITSGRVDATTLAGYINHSGGLRFVNAANGHTLTLTRFRIRISAKPGLDRGGQQEPEAAACASSTSTSAVPRSPSGDGSCGSRTSRRPSPRRPPRR